MLASGYNRGMNTPLKLPPPAIGHPRFGIEMLQ